MQFLPFFAWAAKNDKVELFNLSYFKRLFQKDKNSAKEAIVVAAVYGSISFLTRATQEGLVSSEDIAKACSIAAANHDNTLLNALISISRSLGIKSSGSALFWAIRNGHVDTAEILLKAGEPLNDHNDEFMGEDSYLQLATRCGHMKLMKLLISYKADINHQDALGHTALHNAAEKNNLKALEILVTAGADINLADKEGRKPLDGLKDDVRQELQTAR